MALPEGTKCVKIYIRESTLEALRSVAHEQGYSLSGLFLNAAVKTYLGGRVSDTTRLAALERKLRTLETSVGRDENSEAAPTKGQKRVQAELFPQTFKQSAEPVVQSSHEQISLDKLVERLGGSPSLKARLCQLGGRDGSLFEGDLSKAIRVEEVTRRLDPEQKSWMPLNRSRLVWIQITADEYCRLILGSR
ncbi:hypothetical protein H6F89_15555 [Cyanobacteria bacterium FACHB-63]|nr:hypothetical protein [Cyanobacteria bacterium FACHB-63]